MVRGVESQNGARGFSYRATPELLQHLGITHIEDLPEYEKIRNDLEAFRKTQTDDNETL